MILIIGLGNPGEKYAKTRHNAGRRALLAFVAGHPEDFGSWKKKSSSLAAEGRVGGQKAVFLLPETFMNSSGDALAKAAAFWKVKPKDMLLVYDDLDLPIGTVRVRPGGSSGGHNGVQSVIDRLGTQDIPRVRIGIAGEKRAVVPAETYVLEPFTKDEECALEVTIPVAQAEIAAFVINRNGGK